MNKLILLLVFAPVTAFAAGPATPAPATPTIPAPAAAPAENCRFSKKAAEHNMITVRGCNDRICSHVVICGKTAKTVTCKMPNGTCDGYTANECVAKAATTEAEFDTVDRRPKKPAAVTK